MSVTLPGTQGNLVYGYSTTTGQLSSIAGPASDSVLTYGYAGFLPMSETWTCQDPGNCPATTVQGNVTRLYDTSFRLEKQRVNGDVPSQATFTYDNDDLLTHVTIGGNTLVLTRDVHPGGLITATTLGTVSDSRMYNDFGEIKSYAATFGTSSYSVAYEEVGSLRDKLGRITRKTETIDSVTTVYEYRYDEAGRLQTVTRDDGLQVRTDEYEYDQNGNRVAHRVNGVLVAEGTYDGQDRLLTYGLVPSAAVYEYTANGELATKTDGSGTTTYEYDAIGSLRKVTPPGGPVVEYTIDGRGRRVGRKVDGVEQRFLYDGQLRIVAELDATNTVVSRFVYGTRVNVPELMIMGGQTYRIITDHLGSVRFVISVVNGTIEQQIDYDEFGTATLVIGDWDLQPFGFAGGLFDPRTRLVRFGARDYDPNMGRWLSKDPIRFTGGDSNLYNYGLGDPVNLVDPDGRIVPQLIGAGLGFAFGAYAAADGNWLQAGLVGAGAGALSTLPVPGLNPLLGGALASGSAGALGNLLAQWLSGRSLGCLDFDSAGLSGLAGLLGGGLGAKLAGITTPAAIAPLAAARGPLFTDFGQQVGGAAAGGIAAGVLDAALQGAIGGGAPCECRP